MFPTKETSTVIKYMMVNVMFAADAIFLLKTNLVFHYRVEPKEDEEKKR